MIVDDELSWGKRKERLGICLLSRCSLEWNLAIGAIGLAAWFVLFPEGLQLRAYLMNLPSDASFVAIPWTWPVVLALAGGVQLATLVIPLHRRYAGWTAQLAGLAWIYVLISLCAAGMLLMTWPCLLAIGSNAYVASQLKP